MPGEGDLVRTPSEQFNDEIMKLRLQREKAKGGKIQISLIWHEECDLDLHVNCPDGHEIYFGNKQYDKLKAHLDVDANVSAPYQKEPVENVYINSPEAGDYKVFVRLYSYNTVKNNKQIPFRVRLLRTGEEEQNFEGFLKQAGSDITCFTFTWGGSGANRRNSGRQAATTTTTSSSSSSSSSTTSTPPSSPKPRGRPRATTTAKPKPKPKAAAKRGRTPSPSPKKSPKPAAKKAKTSPKKSPKASPKKSPKKPPAAVKNMEKQIQALSKGLTSLKKEFAKVRKSM
eukprot:NODE_272_length_1044_cov_409.669575_g265_i0.p1 GENE.NODE_272_length_1044_cov_409.669575_g265_i0~~NODE_272_length_1044_cov_409.669575_g265_i0.p1  ORF type:complete len:304 (+),score=88.71 NODE_272_length_1044_cov_409.669575_g265_i0:60-914(+)